MSSDELANFLKDRFKDVLLDDVYYKSNKPPHEGIKSEASVLILLDKREDDWYIFLTLRSEKLRSYAGEVSFPGGKREEHDQSYVETAVREAHEETGLPFGNVKIIGACMPILSKLQVLVHPVFGLLTSSFEPQPNEDEVQKCFWLPLNHFLINDYHEIVIVGQMFRMHRFEFPTSDIVYGLTAYLCILTGMLVENKYPEYSFVKQDLTVAQRNEPVSSFIKKQFDVELKENLNFVLDLKDYFKKGKYGKL